MKIDLGKYKMSSDEWERAIDEYVIGKKAYRDRKILKMNLIYGFSYETISGKSGLSSRQIANIIPKRLAQITDMIEYRRKFQ